MNVVNEWVYLLMTFHLKVKLRMNFGIWQQTLRLMICYTAIITQTINLDRLELNLIGYVGIQNILECLLKRFMKTCYKIVTWIRMVICNSRLVICNLPLILIHNKVVRVKTIIAKVVMVTVNKVMMVSLRINKVMVYPLVLISICHLLMNKLRLKSWLRLLKSWVVSHKVLG